MESINQEMKYRFIFIELVLFSTYIDLIHFYNI